MRTDHRATRAGKGIIANSNTTDYFGRVSWNPGRRPPVTAICSLSKGKTSFPAASHVFYLGIFANSNTATLTGIVVDVGPIADNDISRSIASSVRIGNSGSFTDGNIFCLWCTAACTNGNTIATSCCIIRGPADAWRASPRQGTGGEGQGDDAGQGWGVGVVGTLLAAFMVAFCKFGHDDVALPCFAVDNFVDSIHWASSSKFHFVLKMP